MLTTEQPGASSATTWPRRLLRARLLIDAVMVIFLIGAASKLFDLAEFARAIDTWDTIPVNLKAPLVFLVPGVEFSLASLWFIGIWRKQVGFGALVFLAILTGAYITQITFGEEPDCGCFGRIAAFHGAMEDARFVLGRNIVLLLLLAVGCLVHGSSHPVHSAERLRNPRSAEELSPRGSEGFTLIELLVLLTIIALLMSLLLPTLAGVRSRAVALASLSNLRQHAAMFASYSLDNAEQYPYVTDPDATYTILRSGDIVKEALYFDAPWYWNIALAEGYYDADYRHASFRPPRTDPTPFTYYVYSATFLAAPEYWNEETRTGPNQWRSIRASEVLHPAQKGLFRDMYVIRETDNGFAVGEGVRVGFVDGSARSVPARDLTRPYPKGEGDWWGCRYQGGVHIMHTIDGVRGRDVK